jgi:hypothetical protein
MLCASLKTDAITFSNGVKARSHIRLDDPGVIEDSSKLCHRALSIERCTATTLRAWASWALILGDRSRLGRKADTRQQVLETRASPQRVHARIDMKID